MTFRSGLLHHVALILVAFAVHAERAPDVRAGQAPAVRKVALVGGMLLDGYEAPPLHHAAVLIEGDRIVRVGPAASQWWRRRRL